MSKFFQILQYKLREKAFWGAKLHAKFKRGVPLLAKQVESVKMASALKMTAAICKPAYDDLHWLAYKLHTSQKL